jgi:RpiR family transcriptional regulator, carbohydrate utilization regulator
MNLTDQQIAALPHDCLVKARAIHPTLKSAERRGLEYILLHPQDVPGVSIVAVAKASGASEATLVRLARRLGYAGYPGLKSDLRGHQAQGAAVVYKGISASDNAFSVVEKVFAASAQSLRDTLKVLDRQQYSRAVEALVGARRLLFCGQGDAAHVAAAASLKFVRADVDARATQDADGQRIIASHLAAGDVLVAISHSGRSTIVLNTVAEARKRRATVIALTNYPRSVLARKADIVLLTADFSEHLNGEVVSKRVSEQVLLESLYVNYLIRKGGSLQPAQRAADEAVKAYKE